MEQDGILDVDNEFHLLSLHLVYLTRIQSSVDRFLHAVSNRPLRTEHNKTPMQMWIMGQVLDPKIQLTAEVNIHIAGGIFIKHRARFLDNNKAKLNIISILIFKYLCQSYSTTVILTKDVYKVLPQSLK